jgi:hypothetical protein
LERARLHKRATSRPTAGRKPGSVPFYKDKKRFELAVMFTALTFFKMDERRTADFAATFFHPDLVDRPDSQKPLEVSKTQDGRVKASAYRAGFQNRSDRLFRKINSIHAAIIQPGNKAGLWYLTSAYYLYRWWVKDPDPTIWAMLRNLGWEDILTTLGDRRIVAP